MTRPVSTVAPAAISVPLLAAALVLPAGLDMAVSPLLAGGLPLAWGALVAVAVRLGPAGFAAAFAIALPFSAYALAAFGQPPAIPWLIALAASAAASVTAIAAAPSRPDNGRVRSATRLALGAAPGLALAALSSPWSGTALSALVAMTALLARERRRR